MSLLEEYFKLYTNKAVIAMIMILLGVAIILYIIKRINEALDPSAQEENGKIKVDKIDAPIKIQNWSEKDFKKFQRRDLIDHYGFQFRCTLFFPKGNPRYQDKFTFNIRNDAEIQQCFLDMFKRQADCSPNGEILFEYPDILIIRKAMDRMTEDLRDMAEIRSYYGGTNVYAPFAGMHLMQTINLPALSHHIVDKKINNDEPFRRSLDIYLTLLCTEFTEPFYLDYKWKPRAAEEEEAAAEEEQQTTATLEVQEEEKQQDAAELKSEEKGVVTVEMKHVE